MAVMRLRPPNWRDGNVGQGWYDGRNMLRDNCPTFWQPHDHDILKCFGHIIIQKYMPIYPKFVSLPNSFAYFVSFSLCEWLEHAHFTIGYAGTQVHNLFPSNFQLWAASIVTCRPMRRFLKLKMRDFYPGKCFSWSLASHFPPVGQSFYGFLDLLI